MYKIHSIKNSNDENIESIFKLSCKWFNEVPETPNVPPSLLNTWKERLDDLDGEILYCATLNTNINFEKDIAGFLFSYINNLGIRHIWIAATNPIMKRSGAMSLLFSNLELSHLDQIITVNTYPERFPIMPLFLDSRNFINFEIENSSTSTNGLKYKFKKLCS
jgi:hypothetical protein